MSEKDKEILDETVNENNGTNEENNVEQEAQDVQEMTAEEQLQKELDEANEKVAMFEDKYLRQVAEFDNYRKRTMKETAELIKNGGERAIEAAAATCAAHAFETELVVTRLLVGIAQHAVRLGSLLELLLGLFVTGVFVGVVLYSLFAVGFLYVACRCIPVNAKHFIVVSFCHILLLFAHSNLCVAYYFIV